LCVCMVPSTASRSACEDAASGASAADNASAAALRIEKHADSSLSTSARKSSASPQSSAPFSPLLSHDRGTACAELGESRER